MIKQMFHLIWNTKRKNLLLYLEMLISFLVLFSVFTFLYTSWNQYSIPLGFNPDDLYSVDLPFPEGTDSILLEEAKRNISRDLEALPEVVQTGFGNWAAPFSQGGWASEVIYEDRRLHAYFAKAGIDFAKTLDLKISEGRWFNEEDLFESQNVMVVNEKFRDDYFPDQDIINKEIELDGEVKRIVGVIEHYKYKGDFIKEHQMAIFHEPLSSHAIDRIQIRVAPGTPASVEAKIAGILKDVGKMTSFQIKKSSKSRKLANRFYMIPMYILLFLSVFIILNVAFGLFGVIWYNINKRVAEMGLRMALGARVKHIYMQLIGEQLVITLLSVITGLIIAVQFPILGVINIPNINYVIGMICAAALVFLIVLVCTAIPSRKASSIHPATALHEE